MKALRAWFMGLEPRERRILLAGAVVASLLLGYLALWQPLYGNLTHLRTTVNDQRSTLRWMQQTAQEVRRLRASEQNSRGLGGQSLMGLVDQSARRAGLGGGISRIEPLEGGRIRVWMDNVSFDHVVVWLGQLHNRRGVQAEVISVERKDDPGRVSVRMTLQGPSQ